MLSTVAVVLSRIPITCILDTQITTVAAELDGIVWAAAD